MERLPWTFLQSASQSLEMNLNVSTMQSVYSTDAFASPGRIYTTRAIAAVTAAPGCMPGQQEPLLLLNVPSLQRPGLHQDLSILQWPAMPLDVSTTQGPFYIVNFISLQKKH
jgi:hypothetical protein